ncbi:feruloyl esterase B [Colletotrichum lupini]|uniref:Carboxylic ester hydrolase n=1 Tax=Colletotrichum lupini TaxID=145971 RepID=A0A9Q8SKB7_9PEZI|nr:feruloyl esterase B [Colletotrichum lupini]UQC78964.1 feruloyl esterase B [Colletotrichum lupini]
MEPADSQGTEEPESFWNNTIIPKILRRSKSYAFPEHKIKYNGQSAYRTIIHKPTAEKIEGIPKSPVFWQNTGGKYVFTCPLGGDDFEVTARIRRPIEGQEHVSWGRPFDFSTIASEYDEFCEPVRKVIQLAAQGETQEFALFSGPRLESVVHEEAIALIGDASHPLSGAFGAGAGFALEDVYALTQSVDWHWNNGGDLSAALELYDQIRSPHYRDLYKVLDDFGAMNTTLLSENLPVNEEIEERVRRAAENIWSQQSSHQDQAHKKAGHRGTETWRVYGTRRMGLLVTEERATKPWLILVSPGSLVNSTAQEISYVETGANLTFPEQDPSCGRGSQVVRTNLCRVAMNITTSSRSQIVAEVWLPEKWNGRMVAVAGGGLDGCVHTEDLAYATAHGFAAVGTNNGHAGTTGVQFLNNDDVVIDFSYRAIHTGVLAGKSLLKSLYKEKMTGSYFLGCSLGGRQGVQAADMFPEDFDGIVAGAPAVDFNNLYSWRASFYPLTGSVGSKDFIAPATWRTTIHDEVLKQCDTIDGVQDGIIEDPTLCHFEPGTLLCKPDSGDSKCLTGAQVEIVRKIFSPTNYTDGKLFWPAMNPGSEIITADGLYSGSPFALSQNWFRYAIYNDPNWDPATYTLEKD